MIVRLPLVSIIIPVRNGAKHLAATLESVSRQSYQKIEIIVVDDGSIDESYQIAEKFSSNFPVTTLRIAHRGAAAARNEGLRRCQGDLIMFLDGDDVISPDKIAVQVETLNRLPSSWIASCTWARFYGDVPQGETMEPEPVWSEESPVKWLVSSWLGKGMMVTGCWLVPRAIIEKAGYWDETYRVSPNDDAEYFTRVLLNSGGIKHVKEGKLFYRSSSHSLSQQRNAEALRAVYHNFISMTERLLQREDSPETRLACASNFCRLVSENYPTALDVMGEALKQAESLSPDYVSTIWPLRLRHWVRVLGFRNALRFREYAKPSRARAHLGKARRNVRNRAIGLLRDSAFGRSWLHLPQLGTPVAPGLKVTEDIKIHYDLAPVTLPGDSYWALQNGKTAKRYAHHVFELSDSRVFKTDIFDKYGVLYPELSTRAVPGPDGDYHREYRSLNRWRLPRPKQVPGISYSLIDLYPDNYFHWMFCILAKLQFLKSGTPDRFVVNFTDRRPSFQDESFQLLNIGEEKIFDLSREGHCQFAKLVVPDHLPYEISSGTVSFLRKAFLGKGSGEKCERVYISRANAGTRGIVNETEVVTLLEGLGFQTFYLEKLSLRAQVALFQQAKWIVGPHGAGLSNIMFSSPGTKVIELFSSQFGSPLFYQIAALLGLEYFYLMGEGARRESHGPQPTWDVPMQIDCKKLHRLLSLAGVESLRRASAG